MKITTRNARRLRKEVTLGLTMARQGIRFLCVMDGYRERVVREAYDREIERQWFAAHKAR